MKFVCTACGYIHEGGVAPKVCPICHVDSKKFILQKEGLVFADEHKIGISQGIDAKILEDLRANFNGECTEIGMYLAMSRQADRDGFPEIAEAYKRIAFEEAEHAAKFAEILSEIVCPDTEKNLKLRLDAECNATQNKIDIAKKAKILGFDAIHDTVHEMAKDEARHGKVFEGLLKRYFNQCEKKMS